MVELKYKGKYYYLLVETKCVEAFEIPIFMKFVYCEMLIRIIVVICQKKLQELNLFQNVYQN